MLASPATAAPAPPVGPDPVPGSPTGPSGAVTLLTGDTVTLRGDDVDVEPGAGRERITFHSTRSADARYVIPADVARDVASGRLDRRLFDVAGLIAAGYDDRSTDRTPLIVTDASAAPRLAGADAVEELPSVDGYAVRAPKSQPLLGGASDGAPGRIWLDGKVSALVDRSAAQVGAPAAWSAGLTGAGVRVAVLDTGIDAEHPDLVGAVVESANFTGTADAGDREGHGTHVASTITGSGRYRGIAPDAELVNGKVLDDFGHGDESGIIAGMEWAAARADVVNMSLGTPTPSAADDPMSLAVDRLTAETGALFVIAAGNAGPRSPSVGSPGSATSALTAGSVDRDDVLATSSSRGPRLGDGAIKPEITAPGVGIVAAKARDGHIGTPVDDAHVALSGTSMATPHVVGAAAVLAQQHPDWRAPQLKAALMGSTVDPRGAGAFRQGAGRLDLARAITSAVLAEPASLSLERQTWPHGDDVPQTRTVTYHNTGDRELVLPLTAVLRDASGAEVPGGATVFPSSITVPAGGRASATVTVAVADDAPTGAHSGVLLAGDAVRVPIGLDREEEKHEVKVDAIDHGGAPTSSAYYGLYDVETGEYHSGTGAGPALRLPRGTYFLQAAVVTGDRTTSFVEPAIVVDGATTLELDARTGERPRYEVAEPNATPVTLEITVTAPVAGKEHGTSLYLHEPEKTLLAPSRTSAEGVSLSVVAYLAEPDGDGGFTGGDYQYALRTTRPGAYPQDPTTVVRDEDLARVDATTAAIGDGHQAVHALRARGPVPQVMRLYYTPDVEWWHAVDLLLSPDGEQLDATQSDAATTVFRRGEVRAESWYRGVLGPAFPRSRHGDAEFAGRSGDQVSFTPNLHSDQDPDHHGTFYGRSTRTALSRDGQVLLESDGAASLRGEVPASAGEYVLTAESGGLPGVELATRVSAEWRFPSARTAALRAVPLHVVRYAPELDERNRAPRGEFEIPLYAQRNGTDDVSGIARPTVEVSFDDGATWAAVPVGDREGGWTATVQNPDGAGCASLRASTSDGAGFSVAQTTIRAYALG
ncbi:S8 family serine peptidase [Actinosynnema pretiosum subsp. pretiosum]